MTAYAVLVEFRLNPGTRQAFRALIDINARVSFATEPGCRRFDVLEPDEDEDRILLYEIYTDRAAFQTHMGSAHYAEFAAASDPLCAGKHVTSCTLVFEGGAR